MLDPPERTMCLYNSVRISTAAAWIVSKSISVGPDKSARHKESRQWGIVGRTCYTWLVEIDQMWLEHALWSFESLRAHFDGPPIRKLTYGLTTTRDTMADISALYNFQQGPWFLLIAFDQGQGRN